MQTAREKMLGVLVAVKKRLPLILGFGRLSFLPENERLLVRADKTTRRRLTFLQRLPMRIIILIAVGVFFYSFVTENEVGLMSVMFFMAPVIIPIALLVGVFVTTKLDPFDVCLRREYMRLCEDSVASQASPTFQTPKRDIAQRMLEHRATWYRETRRILRQTRGPSRTR